MKRRTFSRPMGYRRYRKLFIISCEGKETEIQYFRLIQSYNPEILVDCPTRNRQSSPFQVLKTLKQRFMEKNPRPPYEAWLVIDKDHWTGVQIDELAKWVDHHGNRGLAVSNPKFEFWLLLHFKMGNDVHTSRECTIRLQRYLDDFSKHIDPRAITFLESKQPSSTPNCVTILHVLTGRTIQVLLLYTDWLRE